MSKLSVVLPAYNEELMVGKTCRVLAEVLTKAKIPYELVVVNDGSGDRTWEEIQKAGERDANVTGVLFSRNFGKEAAIFAGLAQACGDVVAVMDCDLQHPPQTLIEMYRLWQEGYEVIEGVKADRGWTGRLWTVFCLCLRGICSFGLLLPGWDIRLPVWNLRCRRERPAFPSGLRGLW